MLKPKVIIPILVALAVMIASAIFIDVPLPHIQLPAEPIAVIPGLNLPFTNTMLGLLFADIVLVVLAVLATRNLSEVPSGLQNFFEVIIEYWQDMSHQMIGEERTKRWLPLVLTLFLLVVTANWLELVPGYDTIGITCTSGTCPGEPEGLVKADIEHTYFRFENVLGVAAAMERVEKEEGYGEEGYGAEEDAAEGEDYGEEAAGADEDHGEEGAADDHGGGHAENEKVLIPFLRVTSSDLNFTLALAIIAFLAIEIAGFQALGLRYLSKFFTLKDFPLGTFVGLLEFVSEIARIISFAFRLFGNLFAGQVLLFVMPFLIPLFLVLPIYGLELFVGMIQGFVFAILTLAFMSQAVESHDH
jgi:F-type H+-transporting ATPase subunit a